MDENQKDEKRQKMLDRIQRFCLMDDTYMNVFFDGQPELIEYVLRILLNKPDLKVLKCTCQKLMENAMGRAATLDIYAVDSNGRYYDIEIQNDISQAPPQRARYHSSLVDTQSLVRSQPFSALPECYVIFVLSRDFYGAGKPCYHVDRMVRELKNTPFEDGSHIIYVNGQYRGNDSIGRLMHDFNCNKPSDMYDKTLQQRAKQIKNSQGGKERMCKIMQEVKDEGRAEGKIEQKEEIALKMLEDRSLSLDKISIFSDLSIERIQELAKERLNRKMQE